MASMKDVLIRECGRIEKAGQNINAAGDMMYGGIDKRFLDITEQAAKEALDAVANLRKLGE